MVFDLVISQGTLITGGEIIQADIGIRRGIIEKIGEHLQGKVIIDAQDCYIIPGGIDPHVHLDMSTGSTTSSDNWTTGTIAAACGGTTTVIDFVEPEGNQQLLEAWRARRKDAEKGSVLDFGLHMTINSANRETFEQIAGIVEVGVSSFKLYTTYNGLMLKDDEMLKVMSAVHNANGIVMVHSESDKIIQFATTVIVQSGRLVPSSHPISRPPKAEVEAIYQVLKLAKKSDVPTYIVHISTSDGATAVAEAVSKGQIVWGETCPQYLILNEEKYDLPGFEGAKFVCSPPLRAKENNLALWQHLAEGNLHSIGTDHCPFFYSGQKDLGMSDFRSIPGGLPGIQSRIEIMYTYGVLAGFINLNQWVRLCSSKPAQIFGLHSRKGSIKPGLDADLVIFDPNIEKIITHEGLSERVDYTPYEGFKLQGAVKTTIATGEIIVLNGKFQGKNHRGRYLHRLPHQQPA